MVYLIFDVGYDRRMDYAGVYESYELAEEAIRVMEVRAAEIGYSTDYKIFPVRLNTGGL